MRLTQKQLNAWLAKWQPLLRLQEWDIVVVLRTRKQTGGADGLCSHTLARKHAVIQIAKKASCPIDIAPHDPEHTLVHELIHLKFAPFECKEEGSPIDVLQEQAIDSLATTCITLDRGLASS